MKNLNKIISDIKLVKIQGATNVCKSTLDIFELLCLKYKKLNIENLKNIFLPKHKKLP